MENTEKTENGFEFKKHFVFYITAPRNSGKSVLLKNCLGNDRLLCQKFDKVYLFSPTFKFQNTFNDIEFNEKRIFEKFDPDIVNQIVKKNEELMEDILICFDDCVATKSFKSNTADHPLNDIASIGRHKNISIIVLSQRISNGSSPLMRNNCDYIALFKVNDIERKIAYETWGLKCRNYKEFEEYYFYATQNKYDFLLIDRLEEKFYRNFNKIEKSE